ncbi:hypothetical protein [Tessaracoccus flavescens]|uniref:Uncharacterized protein n=1 Tax=Tessaracoccus flavescens TaxID=399497 RepID=A0A1Q2CUS6_9ACTN|nr:hypothetical protein [Tessaracoccus flavescens]AQP49865.1 hypothetical protein BW733_02460 [Tessaracoccus flavescens]
MRKRIGLWGFIVAGLAIAVWGTLSWASPSTSCRGVEMNPGDVCEYSSLTNVHGGKVQRYEDRIDIAREQAPFAVAAGVGLMAFGLVIVAQGRRGKVPTASEA